MLENVPLYTKQNTIFQHDSTPIQHIHPEMSLSKQIIQKDRLDALRHRLYEIFAYCPWNLKGKEKIEFNQQIRDTIILD